MCACVPGAGGAPSPHWFDVLALRRALGLTRADLARRLGVSPETVRGWERSARGLGVVAEMQLSALARDAGVDRRRLYPGDPVGRLELFLEGVDRERLAGLLSLRQPGERLSHELLEHFARCGLRAAGAVVLEVLQRAAR